MKSKVNKEDQNDVKVVNESNDLVKAVESKVKDDIEEEKMEIVQIVDNKNNKVEKE